VNCEAREQRNYGHRETIAWHVPTAVATPFSESPTQELVRARRVQVTGPGLGDEQEKDPLAQLPEEQEKQLGNGHYHDADAAQKKGYSPQEKAWCYDDDF